MLLESGADRFFDGVASERARNVIAFREQKLPGEALQLLARDVVDSLARRSALSIPSIPPADDQDLDDLCDALISTDRDSALDLVLEFRSRGTTTEEIYLAYIACAARRLGDRWTDDEVSFVEVSIAASRLYIIMRALRPHLLSGVLEREDASPALFASVPGETHTLGVTMAADLFRSRGWEIDLLTGLDHHELVEKVGHDKYLVIGLSASCGRATLPLARLIASLRVASPVSSILVSGELATIEPDLAMLVDADSVAVDAGTAVDEMQRLLDATSAAVA